MNLKKTVLVLILATLQFTLFSLQKGEGKPVLFPNIFKSKPKISSPYIFGVEGSAEYREYVTIRMPNGYAVVDVTQENGEIYSCMHFLWGKGKQLYVAGGDFPSLVKTGLHNESQLTGKKYISGREIGLINYLARPGRFSRSGFIAAHEDIISVLKRDNMTVSQMGLKHSQLAKPLFHIWNIIQGNYIRDRWARDITVLYNKVEVILNAEGGKGYQESIFHDEIEGRWNISIRRELNPREIRYLKTYFGNSDPEMVEKLRRKLSRIDISEMNPFYIQRYGFYEGATTYRADPVSIAFIFGLQSAEEIIKRCGEKLPEIGSIYIYKGSEWYVRGAGKKAFEYTATGESLSVVTPEIPGSIVIVPKKGAIVKIDPELPMLFIDDVPDKDLDNNSYFKKHAKGILFILLEYKRD